jgi:hypothetical protein
MIRSKYASDEKLESGKEEHMSCDFSLPNKKEEKDDRRQTFFLGLFFSDLEIRVTQFWMGMEHGNPGDSGDLYRTLFVGKINLMWSVDHVCETVK